MSKKEENTAVAIDTRIVIRVLLLAVGVLLALVFLKTISHALVLIIVSAFLALALNPAVSSISRKLGNQNRAHATGVAYILVIAFLIAFISFVTPPLIRQTADFIREVPSTVQNVTDKNSSFSQFIDKYQLQDELDKLASNFKDKFGDISEPAIATATTIGSTLVSIITVFVLTFMMLVEGPMWIEKILSVQPEKERDHRRALARKMYRVVVGYVNGQVVVATVGGVFATVALFIMGQVFNVPVNAIALGGIIGLFALIPMFGTIMGSTIVVLACLFLSVPLAIAATVYFIVYQQIENVTIQPYIQSKTNDLTPLIIFTSAIVGVSFGGFLGAFLAIPTAGCIKVLVQDHYEIKSEKHSAQT